jgi:hypothetical protein
MDVKTSTTSMLLSDISQDPLLLLELIAAGGVQLVLSNIRETHRTEPLARLSMAILCIIVDASMGRAAINGCVFFLLGSIVFGTFVLTSP